MGAVTPLDRDLFMSPDLDHDGMVVWYALGELARRCADGGVVTAEDIAGWDDQQWADLLDDTPELHDPITGTQRGLLLLTLQDLEIPDEDDRPWWDR